MKANELMIGDWVQTPIDCEDGGFVYDNDRIASLSLNDFTTLEFGIEGDCGDLLPIPLTAEILEKNGFWCQHNVGYVMEEDENEIIYDLWNHKLRILKNREQILNFEYMDETCVHELQHALRLCGIEKEIEI